MSNLTYGAKGPCVQKLCALARAAGLNVETIPAGAPLDVQTLNTVLASLTLADRETVQIGGQEVQGAIIDVTVWKELAVKAAALTGLEIPTPAAAVDPAGTVDPSQKGNESTSAASGMFPANPGDAAPTA